MDQQSAPPTMLNSGAKSPLTNAFVQLVPFLDQPGKHNKIVILVKVINGAAP